MSFTIPNAAQSIEDPTGKFPQAEPDKVDFDILISAFDGVGVLDGCDVTAQGSPDMSVAVADGNTTYSVVSAANVSVTAANATYPRFDLVVVDGADNLSMVDGPAQDSPVFSPVPGGSIALAAVYVAAGTSAITTAMIVDKRVVLPVPLTVFTSVTDGLVPASGGSGGTTYLADDGSFTVPPGIPGDLTGPITSTGVATVVASQTGNGSTFVMDTDPVFATDITVSGSITVGAGGAGGGGTGIDTNAVLGNFALNANREGGYSVAVGMNALQAMGAVVTAGSFVVGAAYTIRSTGSTNFTLIGAANSNPGTIFTATGVGIGTGTASSRNVGNTAVGPQAGYNIKAGNYNTIIGGASGTNGINNHIILSDGLGDTGAEWTLSSLTWTFSDAIKTAAPNTGTAGVWKLGILVNGGPFALDTANYIQLDIGGTLYKLALVT
jgi:hypothetical protein